MSIKWENGVEKWDIVKTIKDGLDANEKGDKDRGLPYWVYFMRKTYKHDAKYYLDDWHLIAEAFLLANDLIKDLEK